MEERSQDLVSFFPLAWRRGLRTWFRSSPWHGGEVSGLGFVLPLGMEERSQDLVSFFPLAWRRGLRTWFPSSP